MALFKCKICGQFFGCKSSHYCEDMKFVLITPETEPDNFEEYIDWKEELITNNKN